MNRLDPPDFFDDDAALDTLSLNSRLKCYPQLQAHVAAIKAGYQQYVAANGNATLVNNVPLPPTIQGHLKALYASPPASLAYIGQIRDESDADCCPMCGSFHSGTLDHLFPKADYAVFAIFGRNLVPACKCNSKRTALLAGPNPGERILHPYFDDILRERLFVARFDDLGPVPRITLRLLLDVHHPNFTAVRFHIQNVVERTSILRHIRTSWTNLIRRPSLTAAELRNAPASCQELSDILSYELDRQDVTHRSRNNWRSVFISGLLDDHVLNWLFTAFHRPGWRVDGPLVDHIV
ncbi:hypothetical protein STVA_28100 [Allostella vacuolata]|nr:hypothetical protein STVA_28100 [Stella vacuolata]